MSDCGGGRKKQGDDNIPDHLICPVCYNLPEKEVFQCRDGHVLCSKCYFKMKECPQCRGYLDKKQPIRNRHFEHEIDRLVKVDCNFKGNGCNQKILKGLLEDHHNGCPYNIQKFGFFIYLCKIMNYDCDFRINCGNTEEAVAHFVSAHGIKITKKEMFQMELAGIKDVAEAEFNEYLKFWVPVIADLPDKKCYVITSAIYEMQEHAFGWLSLKLPYPNSSNTGDDASPSMNPFKMQYFISDGHQNEPFGLSLTKEPRTLDKVTYSLPWTLARSFDASFLIPYVTQDDKLKVVCTVLGNNGMSRGCTGNNLETFTCAENKKMDFWGMDGQTLGMPNVWVSTRGSASAKAALNEFINLCSNQQTAMRCLENIFNGTTYFRDYRDAHFLRKGVYFAVAIHGTAELVNHLMRFGDEAYHEMVNENGETLVHCALQDKNLTRGFEKAKLFVNLQIKFKTSDIKCRHALHWAAWRSNEDAVAYFLANRLGIMCPDADGRTPLHYAMWGFTADEITIRKVQVLLREGANPYVKDRWGRTPLELAFEVKSSCRNQLKQMLKPGPNF